VVDGRRELREMHRFVTTRSVVLAVALFTALAACSVALAAPAPSSGLGFTCGVTVFTQCNQTAHFSSMSEELTPLAPTRESGCPAFVLNDYGDLEASGNGIEHSTVNKAGDGWFTSTFTGAATITPYLDAGLTTADPSVLPFTGHLTEWFGGSFNRSNTVEHSTFHFHGTDANGNSLNITDISHFNTNAANPFGPPNSFEITHCG
jgi:hypothetical protein